MRTTAFSQQSHLLLNGDMPPKLLLNQNRSFNPQEKEVMLPGILVITTYPPKECGIATFSQDLLQALEKQFVKSFAISVCALDAHKEKHNYPSEVKFTLDISKKDKWKMLVEEINSREEIKIVLIQHEFGLFGGHENDFLSFLSKIQKQVIVVFHTVLPSPSAAILKHVKAISEYAKSVIVMTNHSAELLVSQYEVASKKITVIPHGTHLVSHIDKAGLKRKHGFAGRKILSTFGLLSPGKGIETTLKALPTVVKTKPDVLFLVIGKTHPGIVKNQGEQYRDMLQETVKKLGLENHVVFINRYLPLTELLEYLQLTDIYLFTSRDPYQAVSGTFSYAMSCGCPIISTPIPHAKEVLGVNENGIIFDFDDSVKLGEEIKHLLFDEKRRREISMNGLHRMAATAWENTAVLYGMLFGKVTGHKTPVHYKVPPIDLTHIKRLTTDFGIIQFSKINQPDPLSGYTLDDNARALVAFCRYHEISGNVENIRYMQVYFNFIKHCLQPEGYFMNYIDDKGLFSDQNNNTNLADANGRAVWALGYIVSRKAILPPEMITEAESILEQVIQKVNSVYSTRAMAFVIKGLYYYNQVKKSPRNTTVIKLLADRIKQMYRHESTNGWEWYESYLTYANSVLPEAMLCAWLETGEKEFSDIAKKSFDFLISTTFSSEHIKVISNKSWMHKGHESAHFGEQPIDVAYTILALGRFYKAFKDPSYIEKMEIAFSWFHGNNHLHQVIYNPCTGGCYDGLEENHVNLNQGAESTISYLMARLAVETHLPASQKMNGQQNGPAVF
ncbi:MAG TPA: glycosyltransferase [Flavobacteriales bacterium]|nr:glycosyltransferase [Flavobacteriales bacterium]